MTTKTGMVAKPAMYTLLMTLLMLIHKGTVTNSQPTPTIGDLLLVPYEGSDLQGYYEVQIYNSDGKSQPSYGGVCADDLYKTEARVICRQLGYGYRGFHKRQLNTPVWFTHIECEDENTSHILRCKTTVATETQRTTCSPDNFRLLVNCDFNSPLASYDGQVTLCPVDSNSDTIVSTSYGLVGIHYEENEARLGVNQQQEYPLGGTEADTICRNLGFTGAYPGSAVTRSVDNYNFTNCFSNTGNKPPYRFEHGAWLTTDDINCNDGNQKCIGCCMTYPHRGMCQDCDDQYNIVIRCVFDQSKIIPGDVVADRSKDCKLDNNNNVVQCVQDHSQATIRSLKTAIGLIVGLPCGCILLALGVYFSCKCYKCLRRNQYARVGGDNVARGEGQNQQQGQQNQDEAGN